MSLWVLSLSSHQTLISTSFKIIYRNYFTGPLKAFRVRILHLNKKKQPNDETLKLSLDRNYLMQSVMKLLETSTLLFLWKYSADLSGLNSKFQSFVPKNLFVTINPVSFHSPVGELNKLSLSRRVCFLAIILPPFLFLEFYQVCDSSRVFIYILRCNNLMLSSHFHFKTWKQ